MITNIIDFIEEEKKKLTIILNDTVTYFSGDLNFNDGLALYKRSIYNTAKLSARFIEGKFKDEYTLKIAEDNMSLLADHLDNNFPDLMYIWIFEPTKFNVKN